jgi:hypothetical protein
LTPNQTAKSELSLVQGAYVGWGWRFAVQRFACSTKESIKLGSVIGKMVVSVGAPSEAKL